MELIHQFCIFLLIVNFVAGSEETNSNESDQCYQQYENQSSCYRFMPKFENWFREINVTSRTYTGTQDDVNEIKSISSRYCVSGQAYLECMKSAPIAVECQETSVQGLNDILAEKMMKFAIEYFCRNEAEVVLKIVANNGLDFLEKNETLETLERCFGPVDRKDLNLTKVFCTNVDSVSSCLLDYLDPMPNKDLPGTIRDVVPKLKEVVDCAA